MPVLKGYFDSSGDDKDAQHKVCAWAGYVASAKKWKKFEKDWRKTLRIFEVDYFHMKDFAHSQGIFAKFRDDEERRIKFIRSLVKVMRDSRIKGFASIVRLQDLRRLNDEKGILINPHSLNLYACIRQIHNVYEPRDVELIMPKIEGIYKILQITHAYEKTDPSKPAVCKVHPVPFPGALSEKQVCAMQAADLWAWEARKDIDFKDEWFSIKTGDDVHGWIESQYHWCKERNRNLYRRSLQYMFDETQFEIAPVWDYEELLRLSEFRHHNWPN